jgi:hypothetical protein
MKDFSDIENWTPKKLRTLRNNLNNRLMSYKNDGEKAKELSKSHMLYGLDNEACSELLDRVKKVISKSK